MDTELTKIPSDMSCISHEVKWASDHLKGTFAPFFCKNVDAWVWLPLQLDGHKILKQRYSKKGWYVFDLNEEFHSKLTPLSYQELCTTK